jgi:hypothetical protein
MASHKITTFLAFNLYKLHVIQNSLNFIIT